MSQTSVCIKEVFSIKNLEIVEHDSDIFHKSLHYVNLALEEFEFDVRIINVDVNDLLNYYGDIEQVNCIVRGIEHIVNKCKKNFCLVQRLQRNSQNS